MPGQKLPVENVVVVLPGIMGSVLQRDGRDVWALSKGAVFRGVVTLGRSIERLQLDRDDPVAPDLGDGVVATRLMPDAHLLPGFWKIDGYGKIKDWLHERFAFEAGVNWFDFPYDWRRDNRQAAHRLAEASTSWLSAFRSRPGMADAKLVLLAHSMGGLVARHFLEVLDGWKDTEALVTFGTPYRGSLNAVDFLANGYRQGVGPFKADLSKLLRSLTSVHQLLPIYPCIDDGTRDPAGKVVLKKLTEADGLPGGLAPTKVTAAFAFHQEIADRVEANGGYGRYQISPIVGIFQNTRQSGIVLPNGIEMRYDLAGDDTIMGDGTVPRVSATPIELSDDAREVYATESHGALQNFDSVLVQIAGILTRQDLGAFKATPFDGFSLDVADLFAPGEPVALTVRTLAPVLNVGVTATNVDTGNAHEATGELVDGQARMTLPGLTPGVYRVAVNDLDGVGVRPVHDLVLVADEASAEREAERE